MAAMLTPDVQRAFALARQHLSGGDIAEAERALGMAIGLGQKNHPETVTLMGAIRLVQGRFTEAAALLSQARAAAPRDSQLALNLARAFAGLGKITEANAAFRAAIELKPDFVEARFEAAQLLHRTGDLDGAEKGFRQLLRIAPGNVYAKLALGAVLVDAGRPVDAELPLRRALSEAADPSLKAQLQLHLSVALRRQRKDAEALAACDSAALLDPQVPGLALHRSEALQNLGRHEESLAILRDLLARQPGDPGLHHSYNELLHRLGRADEYLKSYDRAPQSRPLMLGKAYFLAQENRDAEAHAIYAALLVRDPGDQVAALGVANALNMMNRHRESSAAFDALLARHGSNPDLCRRAAEPALMCGDPAKAAWLCEHALRAMPQDGSSLALLSIASRMMGDARDDIINGYDTLIRSFDLEPPDGFSDMAAFNAELDAELDRIHPKTREFIGQSLRGGTQTPDSLFGTGLPLVGKLQARIDEAVAQYISDLPDDPKHPFLSRRTRNYRYAGSWSSRLRSDGFHVNHLHPMGWISSCYYVAIPPAVRDETAKPGWIKFGEPSFDLPLQNPIRRAIQPVAGRLVLFPSYMWHGTIAFRDAAARTTIAFDVVPAL